MIRQNVPTPGIVTRLGKDQESGQDAFYVWNPSYSTTEEIAFPYNGIVFQPGTVVEFAINRDPSKLQVGATVTKHARPPIRTNITSLEWPQFTTAVKFGVSPESAKFCAFKGFASGLGNVVGFFHIDQRPGAFYEGIATRMRDDPVHDVLKSTFGTIFQIVDGITEIQDPDEIAKLHKSMPWNNKREEKKMSPSTAQKQEETGVIEKYAHQNHQLKPIHHALPVDVHIEESTKGPSGVVSPSLHHPTLTPSSIEIKGILKNTMSSFQSMAPPELHFGGGGGDSRRGCVNEMLKNHQQVNGGGGGLNGSAEADRFSGSPTLSPDFMMPTGIHQHHHGHGMETENMTTSMMAPRPQTPAPSPGTALGVGDETGTYLNAGLFSPPTSSHWGGHPPFYPPSTLLSAMGKEREGHLEVAAAGYGRQCLDNVSPHQWARNVSLLSPPPKGSLSAPAVVNGGSTNGTYRPAGKVISNVAMTEGGQNRVASMAIINQLVMDRIATLTAVQHADRASALNSIREELAEILPRTIVGSDVLRRGAAVDQQEILRIIESLNAFFLHPDNGTKLRDYMIAQQDAVSLCISTASLSHVMKAGNNPAVLPETSGANDFRGKQNATSTDLLFL